MVGIPFHGLRLHMLKIASRGGGMRKDVAKIIISGFSKSKAFFNSQTLCLLFAKPTGIIVGLNAFKLLGLRTTNHSGVRNGNDWLDWQAAPLSARLGQ